METAGTVDILNRNTEGLKRSAPGKKNSLALGGTGDEKTPFSANYSSLPYFSVPPRKSAGPFMNEVLDILLVFA